MKKLFIYVLTSLIALGSLNACTTPSSEPASGDSQEGKVEILYFHSKSRCATCLAIEAVVRELYEQEYKTNAKVVFRVVDMSTDEGAALAKKHKIAYSSLLVGGKNLTDEAYRYARSQPDELKARIRQAVKQSLS